MGPDVLCHMTPSWKKQVRFFRDAKTATEQASTQNEPTED